MWNVKLAAIAAVAAFASSALAIPYASDAISASNTLVSRSDTTKYSSCPTTTLPAGGIITINGTTYHITPNSTYQPNCDKNKVDPFYASTTVFIYVVATTTTISWMLLICLLIHQSDSNTGRTPTTTRWLQSYGVPNAIAGRTPVGGLGDRPWLQKAAVFLVTVGLTVASVDTFDNAEKQHYNLSNQAKSMRDDVVHSYEIRVLRIVSTVFVWLALVQTLIRLFPRRKEKLIIKWFGFALIVLDTVFSCLNSFWAIEDKALKGFSQDAISALAYLFQLSINLLYAAWVSYYVATQRRFAFFRPDQLNMSLVALLALVSMAIPVAFFIADISVPRVSAWGDFFRWVGGAASSVVVWEWVERIEALERAEKRDGILGREVFDEDEQLTINSSGANSGSSGSGDDDDSKYQKSKSSSYRLLHDMARRLGFGGIERSLSHPANADSEAFGADMEKQPRRKSGKKEGTNNTVTLVGRNFESDSQTDSQPSRLESESPGSTVYAVHYHRTPPVPGPSDPRDNANNDEGIETQGDTESGENAQGEQVGQAEEAQPAETEAKPAAKPRYGWALATNPFKKRKRSPPLEIKKAMQRNGASLGQFRATPPRLNFKSRLSGLGSGRGEAPRQNSSDSQQAGKRAQQPTVIPAPPRGQTWSPDILRHSPVHLLHGSTRNMTPTSHAHPALPHRTPLEQIEVADPAAGQHQIDQSGEGRVSWSANQIRPLDTGTPDGNTSRRQTPLDESAAVAEPRSPQEEDDRPPPLPPSNLPRYDPG